MGGSYSVVYRVNDQVAVRQHESDGRDYWYDCVVTDAHPDGTCTVKRVFDGHFEEHVPKERLRRRKVFQVGQYVSVLDPTSASWSDCIIRNIYHSQPQTLQVTNVQDGVVEDRVDLTRVRVPVGPPPASGTRSGTTTTAYGTSTSTVRPKAKARPPPRPQPQVAGPSAFVRKRQSITTTNKLSGLEWLALLIIPWILFAGTCYFFAYAYERFAWLAWLWFALAVALSVRAFRKAAMLRQDVTGRVLPLACIVALVAGAAAGLISYDMALKHFWFYDNTYAYTNVLPSNAAKGYIDAGMIAFADEARLDTSRTMGYRDGTIYCVAPILDDEHVARVQFWAAGTNCCNQRGGFQCDDAWDPKARSGMVIREASNLVGDVQSGYLQAVNQAEAAYAIASAEDPVFVRWVMDPETVQHKFWLVGMGILIVANVAFVVLSCVSVCFLHSGGLRDVM